MIAVRVKTSGSWLDPNCSGLVGWKFGRRLWKRCKGETGLALTLTYRHDDYANSQELWHRQQERQDVPLFIRRLARALRTSLKGRWVCKLEFQSGGWVHWHIILLGIDRIEHALLSEAWGFGYVWVKRMTKRRVMYLTKYIAKNSQVPAWLYGERPRSVKVVRVSPGFWGELGPPTPERIEPKPQEIDAYISIGERLKRRGVVISVGNGRRFSRICDPGRFLILMALRTPVVRNVHRWLVFDASVQDVEEIWEQAVDWEHCYQEWMTAQRTASTGAGPRPRSAAGREAAVHLRGTCNPDAWPDWLRVQFEEEALAEVA